MSRRSFVWSDYGPCPACGVDEGVPCVKKHVVIRQEMKYPHEVRPVLPGRQKISRRTLTQPLKPQSRDVLASGIEGESIDVLDPAGQARAQQAKMNFPLIISTPRRRKISTHQWEPYAWGTQGGTIQVQVCSWCSVNWWPGRPEPAVWCPGPPLMAR